MINVTKAGDKEHIQRTRSSRRSTGNPTERCSWTWPQRFTVIPSKNNHQRKNLVDNAAFKTTFSTGSPQFFVCGAVCAVRLAGPYYGTATKLLWHANKMGRRPTHVYDIIQRHNNPKSKAKVEIDNEKAKCKNVKQHFRVIPYFSPTIKVFLYKYNKDRKSVV